MVNVINLTGHGTVFIDLGVMVKVVHWKCWSKVLALEKSEFAPMHLLPKWSGSKSEKKIRRDWPIAIGTSPQVFKLYRSINFFTLADTADSKSVKERGHSFLKSNSQVLNFAY